jgi:hypothetical protein
MTHLILSLSTRLQTHRAKCPPRGIRIIRIARKVAGQRQGPYFDRVNVNPLKLM